MAYILISPYIHESICCAQIGIYQNLYAIDYNNKRCVLNYPDSNRAVKRITCNVQKKNGGNLNSQQNVAETSCVIVTACL